MVALMVSGEWVVLVLLGWLVDVFVLVFRFWCLGFLGV